MCKRRRVSVLWTGDPTCFDSMRHYSFPPLGLKPRGFQFVRF